MNQREKTLALLVAGVGVVTFAPSIFARYWTEPIKGKDAQINALMDQIRAKQLEVARADDAAYDLRQWAGKALPADVHLSQTLYENYLHQLLDRAKIANPTITPGAPQVQADQFTRLPFNVHFQATLDSLAEALHDFHATPLLHQIRRLGLKPAVADGDRSVGEKFDVTWTIEAVLVDDATAKDALPAGLPKTKARLPPEVALLTDKNIFQPTAFAPPAPPAAVRQPDPPRDDRSDIYLTGAVTVDGVAQVWLTNRKTGERLAFRQGQTLSVAGMQAEVVEVRSDEAVLRVASTLR